MTDATTAGRTARLLLTSDRAVGSTWAKGREREQQLGQRLDEDAATHGDVIVLHDRVLPDTGERIDHLVVGPTGVWVVDAPDQRGHVRHVDHGGWLRSDWRLTVGGRDRSDLVERIGRRVDAVRALLAEGPLPEVPVRGAVCCVSGEFGWRFGPIEVGEVVVTWPMSLRALVRSTGRVDGLRRTVAGVWLDAQLPPA